MGVKLHQLRLLKMVFQGYAHVVTTILHARRIEGACVEEKES